MIYTVDLRQKMGATYRNNDLCDSLCAVSLVLQCMVYSKYLALYLRQVILARIAIILHFDVLVFCTVRIRDDWSI